MWTPSSNITDDDAQLLDRGALPVVIGGDHAITFPVVRAYSEPFHVVHFDAHLDYAPVHPRPRVHERPRVPPPDADAHVKSLTQVGIRGLRNTQTMMEDTIADGNRVVTMEEFRDVAWRGIVEGVPKNAKCYVSIDIDVLDLSLVPGCVSAEPDGMSYADAPRGPVRPGGAHRDRRASTWSR